MTSPKAARQPIALLDATPVWTRRISTAPAVALFLDFDGTISQIVESPSLATIDPGIRAVLGELVLTPNVDIAIVSGRSLADVRERANLQGVIYAGNHGLEIESDTVCFREPQAEALRLELRHLVLQLELALSETSGLEIEHKGLSASIHYRGLETSLHNWLRRTVEETVERSRSFTTRQGKMVFEVRPRVDWHKGHAISWILDRVLPAGALPVFIGDDVTDEDAFASLPDAITIRVGVSPNTKASYFVEDVPAVQHFLLNLLELRTNAEKRLS